MWCNLRRLFVGLLQISILLIAPLVFPLHHGSWGCKANIEIACSAEYFETLHTGHLPLVQQNAMRNCMKLFLPAKLMPLPKNTTTSWSLSLTARGNILRASSRLRRCKERQQRPRLLQRTISSWSKKLRVKQRCIYNLKKTRNVNWWDKHLAEPNLYQISICDKAEAES